MDFEIKAIFSLERNLIQLEGMIPFESLFKFLSNYQSKFERNKQEILNCDIDEMDFSIKTKRCLQLLNIKTINDLINHSENDLFKLSAMKSEYIKEINLFLKKFSLCLTPNNDYDSKFSFMSQQYSNKQKKDFCEMFHASKTSKESFCKVHNLSLSTFSKWLKKWDPVVKDWIT